MVVGGIDDWKFFLFVAVAYGWIFFWLRVFFFFLCVCVAVGGVDSGGFSVCNCICGFRFVGKRKTKF